MNSSVSRQVSRGLVVGAGFFLFDAFVTQISIKLLVFFLLGMMFSFLYEKLKLQAFTDPLSGLLNKRGLKVTSRQVIRQAKLRKCVFCLALIDLDQFKAVNTHHGHLRGDKLIEDFASVLRLNLRQSDVGARFGGDEFVLILPRVNLPEAQEIIRRIKHACETELGITFSCGIASFPQQAPDWETLFLKADEALWNAKMIRSKIVCCS